MCSTRISGPRYFVIIFLAAFLLATSHGRSQDSAKPSSDAISTNAPFQLKVASNLVVVRVVVRDSHGKPMERLSKENFRLLDDGKEQTISQFSVETVTSVAPSLPQSIGTQDTKQAPTSAASTPPRTLALYFDDLHMGLAEINSARNAADNYLAKNLRSSDRVGIFTSSGSIHSDFRSDLKGLQEALSGLSPIALVEGCQVVDDYTAEQIVDHNDADALNVGASLAIFRCLVKIPQAAEAYAEQQAKIVVIESRLRGERSLNVLDQVVDRLATQGGQKSVILTSSGFMSQSLLDPGGQLQTQVDRIIGHALRSQIVINSLDPEGIPVQVVGDDDASLGYASSNVNTLMHSFASARKQSATGVLLDLARGTGGDLFHNNNDLKAGFTRLAEQPASYILTFVPSLLDGKFHKLQVKLVQSSGAIQARRGYFASSAEGKLDAEENKNPDSRSKGMEEEQIRAAILSKDVMRQLPVGMSAKLSEGENGQRELSLIAHLDANPLHFHREGKHNVNTVIFVFAVFDQKEKLVDSQQRQARVNILDAQIPDLLKTGVDADMSFHLKPGIYRVREVVTDSEQHLMTAFSKDLKIP